jgi:xanthosine phosphorylase
VEKIMVSSSHPRLVAAQIHQRFPQYEPKIGIVLGSGLGAFAEELEEQVSISYADLPGFPVMSVHGHSGAMVLGRMSGIDIVCLKGRAHSYEGPSHEAVKMYVRTLKCLGCTHFIAISACGSLRPEVGPGELMLIHDHINFQPGNPLIGPNDDEFGPRFFPLDQAYDLDARRIFMGIAEQEGIRLTEGVYIAVSGPNYETAAEIRAFQRLGADAVGMSTVPEVLVAAHCGMKVSVIASMTNYATGIAETSHSHEAVVAMAMQSSEKVKRLMRQFIASYPK